MEDEICPFYFYNIPVRNFYPIFLELQTNEMLVNDRWLLQKKTKQKQKR